MITMNQIEYARHRNVTKQRISQLATSGRLVLTPSGRIVVEDSDKALAASIDPSKQRAQKPKPEQSIPGAAPSERQREDDLPAVRGRVSEAEARTLNYLERAKLQKLTRERLEGKLLDADQTKDQVFTRFRAARDAMLAIPARISAELAAMTDAFEVQRKLTLEIEMAMRQEVESYGEC